MCSINHSSHLSSVTTRPGCGNFLEGNKISSFGTNFQRSDAWKVGKCSGSLGSSSVFVDLEGFGRVMMKGPLKRGINLVTQPEFFYMYSHCLCLVDSITLLPTA